MVHSVQATAIALLQLKFASFENVDICVVLIQRFFFSSVFCFTNILQLKKLSAVVNFFNFLYFFPFTSLAIEIEGFNALRTDRKLISLSRLTPKLCFWLPHKLQSLPEVSKPQYFAKFFALCFHANLYPGKF